MKTEGKYKVRNWNAYHAALKQRGSMTFWVSEEGVEPWRNEKKTGRKGASNYGERCSDRDDGDDSVVSYALVKREHQAVELFLQCAALNLIIQVGKPDSYQVED
jgi:hypothetical protein